MNHCNGTLLMSFFLTCISYQPATGFQSASALLVWRNTMFLRGVTLFIVHPNPWCNCLFTFCVVAFKHLLSLKCFMVLCFPLYKGEVTVESCTYEISKSRLQRTSVTSIPLQTQVCCHGFSPDEEKLLLGCIDGSLVLFDEGRGITHLVKAAFVRFYSKVNTNLQRARIIPMIRNFNNIWRLSIWTCCSWP